jgi:hypothetical protein
MGILQSECLEIMTRAADYIIANAFSKEESDQFQSCYPSIVGEKESSPLCWCYGDLGVALALYQVAQLNSENGAFYQSKSEEILQLAIKREGYANTRVGDAGICYGASGTYLMFNRFFDITKGAVYEERAAYWYDQLFGFAKYPDAPSGFKGMFNQQHASTNISFNEGVIGIGCTIISKLNNNYVALNEFLNIS